ncbi:hypothetical protein CISG_07258 [Coccidioides immitis RMSCC 3703]|uniref:Uncharacterized protein n=1 Tax=Coccidioides immitis RMSCC 3703 TaxID=454286 RepID=A0A0J8TYQ5_COCIT|nr:hypothetical protein CISG_07258 [Coccidioides immitis RMSCC 3703]
MARPQTGRLTRAKGKHSVKPHRFHWTITVSMSHPGTRKKTQKKSELRSEKSGKSFATFFALTACFSIAGVPADKSTALDVSYPPAEPTWRPTLSAPGEISSYILSMGKISPSIVFESTNTLPSPQQSNRGSHITASSPARIWIPLASWAAKLSDPSKFRKSFIRDVEEFQQETKGQSHGTAKKHQVTHGHFLLRRDFSPDLHGLCSRS